MVPAGLHVVEHHPHADGPRVVIVHGCPDRSKNFAHVIHMLSDLRVTAYDRRGYGKSLKAEPATRGFVDHCEDLITLLDGERAVVCGQSAGGAIAMMAATLAPELILSLGVWEPPLPWLKWWPHGEDWMPRWLALDPPTLGENFNRELIGDERWDLLHERTKDMLRSEGTAFRHDLISQTTDLFDPVDVKCPVVVGVGGLSDERTMMGSRRLAEQTGGETLVGEKASHVAHTQSPVIWAELVRRAVALAVR
jgi:pimeloyl-ACP methyl ester carboxylesterase